MHKPTMSIRPAKNNSLRAAFRTAGGGIAEAFTREANLRWQIACGVVVLLLAILLGLSSWKIVAIVIVCVQVIALELVNSAFEAMADITHPAFHQGVGYAKDVMAAAVLVATIGAVIIGLWILLPAFILLFS